MRLAFVLAVPVAGALVVLGAARLREDTEWTRHVRRVGREAAERDIARGTPWIRLRVNGFGDLPPSGIGIDRRTGLPIDDCGFWCGTCAAAHDTAEEDAYNECVLEALAAGRLKGLLLDHKVRTKEALRVLFASARATILSEDSAAFDIGKMRITYSHEVYESGASLDHVYLAAGSARTWLRLLYPPRFAGPPDRPWPTPARGPFEVVVADDGTTAVLRDADGYAWVVDLPRALVLQVAGPIR